MGNDRPYQFWIRQYEMSSAAINYCEISIISISMKYFQAKLLFNTNKHDIKHDEIPDWSLAMK